MKLTVANIAKVMAREDGATMVEYSIMLALIAVVSLLTLGSMGISVEQVFAAVDATLNAV